MGKAISIDLGTTNSVAAFKLADVEVVIADDNTPPEGKLTRSVVSCEKGKFVVGEKAYNQLRLNFQFFSPDESNIYEIIGEMWLGLDEKYPAGTEIQVYLELDEKNSDLGMTAHLKNDPSVKVSCTFYRGRSDEKIYQELEEAIAHLNEQNLTSVGVQEALSLALRVVQLANQIIEPTTGEERVDLRDRAAKNLEKFQVSMSNERLEAESLVQESDQITNLCAFLIPEPQQQRLQNHSNELQDAINANLISKMESKSEELTRELRNLPDEVKFVQGSLFAIRQAQRTAPTQANGMLDKLLWMLSALESGKEREADRLYQELLPDVERWYDQKLLSNTIVTS